MFKLILFNIFFLLICEHVFSRRISHKLSLRTRPPVICNPTAEAVRAWGDLNSIGVASYPASHEICTTRCPSTQSTNCYQFPAGTIFFNIRLPPIYSVQFERCNRVAECQANLAHRRVVRVDRFARNAMQEIPREQRQIGITACRRRYVTSIYSCLIRHFRGLSNDTVTNWDRDAAVTLLRGARILSAAVVNAVELCKLQHKNDGNAWKCFCVEANDEYTACAVRNTYLMWSPEQLLSVRENFYAYQRYLERNNPSNDSASDDNDPESSDPDNEPSTSPEVPHDPDTEFPTIPCEHTAGSQTQSSQNSQNEFHQEAAYFLSKSLVSILQSQLTRPFYGSRLQSILPQFDTACGSNIDSFPELQQLINSSQSAPASVDFNGYARLLAQAAHQLRALDAESKSILSDFRGEDARHASGFVGSLRRIEADWNDGVSQIVPCRSFLTMINFFISTFQYNADTSSDCETFLGVTMANRDSNSNTTQPQRLVCRATAPTQPECMESCHLFSADNSELTPSISDKIMMCMRIPQTDQNGELSVDSRGMPLYQDRVTGSYYRGEQVDGNNYQVRMSIRDRCRVKSATLSGIAAVRGRILASYPELSQLLPANGGRPPSPIYYNISSENPTTWPSVVRDRIGENYVNTLTGENGLVEFVQRLCNNPNDVANIVYSQPRQFASFLQCRQFGLERPLPIPENDDNTANTHCNFIRDHASIGCAARDHALRDATRSQMNARMLAFLTEGLDMLGCVSMIAPAISGASSGISTIARGGIQGFRQFATTSTSRAILGTARGIGQESVVALRQGTASVLAHASTLPASLIGGAVFSGFGIYMISRAEDQAAERLANAIATCYTSGENCGQVGSFQEAFRKIRSQTCFQIISYAILGAIIPAGRNMPDDIQTALVRLNNAESAFRTASQSLSNNIRGQPLSSTLRTSFESAAQGLNQAKNNVLERVRTVFNQGLPARDPRSGETVNISPEQITADDAVNIARIAEARITPSPSRPLTPNVRQQLLDLPDDALLPANLVSTYNSIDLAISLIDRLKARITHTPPDPVIDNAPVMVAFHSADTSAISRIGFINVHQKGHVTRSAAGQPTAPPPPTTPAGSSFRANLEDSLLNVRLSESYNPGMASPVNDLRPVSGFLNTPDGITNILDTYGQFIAVMRNDVRRRSTWTDGDSGFLAMYDSQNSPLQGSVFGSGCTQPRTARPYREVQIYGHVSDRDVQHILVPEGTPLARKQAIAAEMNVPVLEYRRRTIHNDRYTVDTLDNTRVDPPNPSTPPSTTPPST